MGIRRACSYTATIKTPLPPGQYSAIQVTISQNRKNLITKNQAELLVDSDNVILRLTQEETKQFAAGIPAFLQVRCFKSVYEAPGSKMWALEVYPVNNEEILP